jgi:hypothetical protein
LPTKTGNLREFCDAGEKIVLFIDACVPDAAASVELSQAIG